MLIKPIEWIGSTKSDVSRFPESVKRIVGRSLFEAQCGITPRDAKPMKGRLREVTAIRVDDDGSTYRVMCTVIFANAIYALCAFQKKSTIGVATSRRKLALIERRLNEAQKHYAETYKKT